MGAAPEGLAAIGERVEICLASLLDAEEARWTALAPELGDPFQAIRALIVAGGKRLRPAFCYWGFVAAGGEPESTDHPNDALQLITRAGAAFELLQAFALFHDDVMDGSSTRRGQRTVHLDFADRHVAHGWTGEARRFGEGVAILVGDLAFVYADQLLADAPRAAIDLWNELRIELNIGQFLDIVGTAANERRQVATERIARYKSGKYTIERPLHVGAALASPKGLPDIIRTLSSYGLPLGDAFQFRDDVLGAFGDEATTGKPVGDDLLEGKPTPLLAMATERATAAQLKVLEQVGHADLTRDEISDIQNVIVETGALAQLETVIETLTAESINAISVAPVATEAKSELIALAHFVAQRTK
jgi:geranylgeranyl diphosphate synthase, type I